MTKSISKSERLNILLKNGYFPNELTPPFNTVDLARYRKSIIRKFPNQDGKKSYPNHLSIPRAGLKRRQIAIVNPVSQLLLSKVIADNWVDIWKFIGPSKISLDQPKLKGGIERAVPRPDFGLIELKKLETTAEYDHILYTDISRFYGTTYTHVIPWALHGKSYAKSRQFDAAFKGALGSQLDTRVRQGQGGQTIGIPIGPDTSRIISEIVAVGIEKRYVELAQSSPENVFRYVDDWFIGFNSASESEKAMNLLSQACLYYELELNIEKTSIVDSSDPTLAQWPHELNSITVARSSEAKQAKNLEQFFVRAFALAADFPTDNVLDYALKIARSFPVSAKNFLLFESFVLKAVRASRATIPVASQILINYHWRGFEVSKSRIKKLIRDLIVSCAPLGHTLEITWALFLARELTLSIDSSAFVDLLDGDNSSCALACLDLEARGLINGTLDTTFWKSLMTPDSLWDENWLLAYEADIKGWLPTAGTTNHVDGDPWFSVLKQSKVSFYGEERTVPTFKDSSLLQAKRIENRSAVAKRLLEFVVQARSIPY